MNKTVMKLLVEIEHLSGDDCAKLTIHSDYSGNIEAHDEELFEFYGLPELLSKMRAYIKQKKAGS